MLMICNMCTEMAILKLLPHLLGLNGLTRLTQRRLDASTQWRLYASQILDIIGEEIALSHIRRKIVI